MQIGRYGKLLVQSTAGWKECSSNASQRHIPDNFSASVDEVIEHSVDERFAAAAGSVNKDQA